VSFYRAPPSPHASPSLSDFFGFVKLDRAGLFYSCFWSCSGRVFSELFFPLSDPCGCNRMFFPCHLPLCLVCVPKRTCLVFPFFSLFLFFYVVSLVVQLLKRYRPSVGLPVFPSFPFLSLWHGFCFSSSDVLFCGKSFTLAGPSPCFFSFLPCLRLLSSLTRDSENLQLNEPAA